MGSTTKLHGASHHELHDSANALADIGQNSTLGPSHLASSVQFYSEPITRVHHLSTHTPHPCIQDLGDFQISRPEPLTKRVSRVDILSILNTNASGATRQIPTLLAARSQSQATRHPCNGIAASAGVRQPTNRATPAPQQAGRHRLHLLHDVCTRKGQRGCLWQVDM